MKFKIENLGFIANIRFVAEEHVAMRIIDRIVLENERDQSPRNQGGVAVDDWWSGRPILFNGEIVRPSDYPFIAMSSLSYSNLRVAGEHYASIVEEMGGKIIEWTGE